MEANYPSTSLRNETLTCLTQSPRPWELSSAELDAHRSAEVSSSRVAPCLNQRVWQVPKPQLCGHSPHLGLSLRAVTCCYPLCRAFLLRRLQDFAEDCEMT